jgi:hypothetical protein
VSHAWKAEFGGMDVSEAKRLKALEDANAKPKRLMADAILDASAPKDLLEKGDARSTIRYPSRQSDDAVLRGRLRDFATGRRRFASPLAVGRLLAIVERRRLPVLLRQEGYVENHKADPADLPRGRSVGSPSPLSQASGRNPRADGRRGSAERTLVARLRS